MRMLFDALVLNLSIAAVLTGAYMARYRVAGKHGYNPFATIDRHPVSYAAAMSHMPKHAVA